MVWQEAGYYASRDLMVQVQKPIGVCHNDYSITGSADSSIIFMCNSETGVDVMFYENLYCSGDPKLTESLETLMTSKGIITYSSVSCIS